MSSVLWISVHWVTVWIRALIQKKISSLIATLFSPPIKHGNKWSSLFCKGPWIPRTFCMIPRVSITPTPLCDVPEVVVSFSHKVLGWAEAVKTHSPFQCLWVSQGGNLIPALKSQLVSYNACIQTVYTVQTRVLWPPKDQMTLLTVIRNILLVVNLRFTKQLVVDIASTKPVFISSFHLSAERLPLAVHYNMGNKNNSSIKTAA